MPTVEICDLNLVAGSDIGDPNNQAAQILKESGDTLIKQDGLQDFQFGMMKEHPNYLTLLLKWNDIKDHENFMASDIYKPFGERFSTVWAGPPTIIHVDFKSEGGYHKAVSAPVTEVATFYFDQGPPENAYDGVAKCVEALEKESSVKIHGWAYGFTHETIEREGVKGKGAVLVIGWDSVEAHMNARETQAFKDNIHLLRNGAQKAEVHHVHFLNFNKNQ